MKGIFVRIPLLLGFVSRSGLVDCFEVWWFISISSVGEKLLVHRVHRLGSLRSSRRLD
jgi:hypothetical protein